jgi:subtilisin family serine protease
VSFLALWLGRVFEQFYKEEPMRQLRPIPLLFAAGLAVTGCEAPLTPVEESPLAAKSSRAGGQTRYLIQYRPGNGEELKDLIASVGGTVVFDYALIDGLAADLDGDGHRTVRRSGLAQTIEEDGVRELHPLPPGFPIGPFSEFVGWGVDRVQADVVWSTGPNTGTADNDLATPNVAPSSTTGQGVEVGVLDTGIDYGHPDLAANLIDDRGSTVIRDFIDSDDDATDAINFGHGTSVSSVIASVDNTVGVIGVAPGAKIRTYRICTFFCPTSAIIGGLVQAIIDGVDVINMSFGGPARFNLEARAITAANRNGIVLVASAGNEATQQPRFPAAYDVVLAVGATDINDNPYSFTNVGGWVDVTGPGVAIPVATCQGCNLASFLDEVSPTAQSFSSNRMFGSAVASVSNTEIVDVGRACNVDLPLPTNPAGKVALIVRGACTFAEKVQNAEAAGAVGTVIFNNQPGNFGGTLGAFSAAGPSVSISQADGQTLQAEILSGQTLVDLGVVATDYALVNGTSFSGPHVAGVAALVKEVDSGLSPIEVRKIIEMTAESLGPNVIFANGMVRADLAEQAAN